MAGNVVVMHPATEAVVAISRGLDELAAANLWSVCTAELGELLVAVEKVARRMDAARVALTAQAEASLIAEREGATSLGAWLKAVADVPISATKARLHLHEGLQSLPVTGAAFNAGEITMDSAAAVCDAIAQLPAAVPAALLDDVERLLVETAREEGTRAVMHRAIEIVHRFAPEELERSEALQAERTRLRLALRHDGTVAVRGLLDKQAGALAFAVLGPMAAPAPATAGTPDTRDVDARFGEAFVQLLRQVGAAEPNTGGEPPQLLAASASTRYRPSWARHQGCCSTPPPRSRQAPPDGWPAMPNSSRSCSGQAPSPSTSAGPAGPCRSGYAAPSSPVTKAVPCPGATGRRAGATSTTAHTGRTAARPRSATPVSCASVTTRSFTNNAGASESKTAYPGSPHPPGSTPPRPHAYTAATRPESSGPNGLYGLRIANHEY